MIREPIVTVIPKIRFLVGFGLILFTIFAIPIIIALPFVLSGFFGRM
jgi:hypothetical protein